MNISFLTAAIAAVALSACVATEIPDQQKTYDPQTDARLRVYGQNGRPTTMKVIVNNRTQKISVGGGLGQAFGSMLGVKGNESIGMPATELSKDPSAHSKLLSRIFFKEFIIPADKPVIVSNHIASLAGAHAATYNASNINNTRIIGTDGCSSNTVTFTPEAGKDYEVAPISSNRTCGVTVYEIH